MIVFLPTRPIFLEIGSFEVRWYGLMYVLAFWLGWWVLPRLAKLRGFVLSAEQRAYIVLLCAIGVIVGGRLGYVLFYEPSYYAHHLSEIWQLTYGGMSFHGGLIGVAIALWYATDKLNISFLSLTDMVVAPVALGLALGRIGNFINQELYQGNWALVVAGADALLGLLCFYLLRRRASPGKVTAVFLVGYSLIRFLNEYVRTDTWAHVLGLTYGQFLTAPLFLLGIYILSKKITRARIV